MRHGDEQAQVAEWLYGVLTGDEALAVAAGLTLADLPDRTWPDPAPAGIAGAVQVFSVSEALDTLAVGPHPRIVTTVPFTVKWVAESDDPGVLAAAVRRQYELLHGALNVPLSGGGVILTCRRTGGLNYPEDTGGVRYRHVGGLYEAQVN